MNRSVKKAGGREAGYPRTEFVLPDGTQMPVVSAKRGVLPPARELRRLVQRTKRSLMLAELKAQPSE